MKYTEALLPFSDIEQDVVIDEKKVEQFDLQMVIRNLISDLREKIDSIDNVDIKVQTLNYVRGELHSISPLKNHPVDNVIWVKSDDVEPNDYNPNAIPPPELELLYKSILEDGYTMGVVTYNNPSGKIKIVDGFHRRRMVQEHKDINESTFGYLPITFIRKSQEDTGDRMASTIRHNRARGVHNIELMSEIVAELVEMGKGDRWICKHIGMSIDELLRLKQITGLASLFNNKSFSQAWDADNEPYDVEFEDEKNIEE